MARIQSFSRSIEVITSRLASPVQRAMSAARIHRNAVSDAQNGQARALGAPLPSTTWVDGRKGAPPESVNPDHGIILTQFQFASDVIEFIDAMLILHSPVKTGAYQRSHLLFADGNEADPMHPPQAKEYLFMSSLPYARKIERGQGSAPDEGVYEGAVALATARYGNVAWIKFTFRSIAGEDYSSVALGGRKGGKTAGHNLRTANRMHNETRYPAIVIRMK